MEQTKYINKSEIEFDDHSIHLAFSTYPTYETENPSSDTQTLFINKKKEFYKKYKGLDKNTGCLLPLKKKCRFYEPLVYHIFGPYDVVFISKISNHVFSQRLFGFANETESYLKPVAYQVTCGAAMKNIENNQVNPTDVFEIDSQNKVLDFVVITNLKLNNGFIIGNGNGLVEIILNKIKKILIDKNYLLILSYNWCEITLIQFGQKPKEIYERLIDIRELVLDEFAENNQRDIFDNSLYKLANLSFEIVKKKNIFSDTNSYTGVNYYKFKNGNLKAEFCSDIEIQVKPGCMSDLLNNENFKNIIKNETCYFINGKTDILLKADGNRKSITENFNVYKLIRNNGLKNLIRKIKTSPIHEIHYKNLQRKYTETNINITKYLLNFQIRGIDEVKRYLKILKISRQIREKILKVFFNYNNGIKDPILYIYYIELFDFAKQFKEEIISQGKIIESCYTNPIAFNENEEFSNNENNAGVTEKIFSEYIDIFEKAYHTRILNNYSFEEITDFDVDLNSSITQLTCSYDTLIKETNYFFLKTRDIIVIHNDEATISNVLHINYSAIQMLEPTLVFNALLKEIMNSFEYKISNFDKKRLIRENLKNFNLNNNKIIELGVISFDLKYYLFDCIKFMFTFAFNADLYIFWGWIHMMQSSKNYKKSGMMHELFYRREFFRIILTLDFFDIDTDVVKPPTEELFGYWEKVMFDHWPKIKASAEFKVLKNKCQVLLKLIIGGNAIKNIKESYLMPGKKFSESELVDVRTHSIKHGSINLFENIEDEANYFFNTIRENDFYLNLKNGRINHTNDLQPFLFYSKLGYNYLKIVMDDLFGGKTALLRRNWKDGSVFEAFLTKSENRMFADPFGGFYLKDEDIKREHIKIKNALIHSLWNASNIYKTNQFKE